jgi:hypothetical protein
LDLKQSVQIPGTKIKVPMLEAIIAGAGVIAAYVLLKGGSSQQPAVSTVATDTSADTTPTQDLNSAYTGAIEDISNRLAALESAPQPATIGGTPSSSGSGTGTGDLGTNTGAPGVGDIPIVDVTSTPFEIGESINPRAIVTPTGPETATITMPPLASPPNKSGVSPIAPPKPASTASKVVQTGQSMASGALSKVQVAAKASPPPVTKVEPTKIVTGQSAAQDWLSRTGSK